MIKVSKKVKDIQKHCFFIDTCGATVFTSDEFLILEVALFTIETGVGIRVRLCLNRFGLSSRLTSPSPYSDDSTISPSISPIAFHLHVVGGDGRGHAALLGDTRGKIMIGWIENFPGPLKIARLSRGKNRYLYKENPVYSSI